MAQALVAVPASRSNLIPFPAPRRRARSGKQHSKKRRFGKGRHGFFAKQWVWYAVALMLGEAAGATFLSGLPAWVSAPALLLFAYGTWKRKPGAINAAYALQGAKLLRTWGVTRTVAELAANAPMIGTGSADNLGKGASRTSFTGDRYGVRLDDRTIANAIRNVQGVSQGVQLASALL